jgi:hypothetical protein
MSGDIDVKSTVGKGTVFILSFPVPQRERRLIGFDGTDGAEKTKEAS